MTAKYLLFNKLHSIFLIFIVITLLVPSIAGNYLCGGYYNSNSNNNLAIYSDLQHENTLNYIEPSNPLGSSLTTLNNLQTDLSVQKTKLRQDKYVQKESLTFELFLNPGEVNIQRLNGWDMVEIDGYDYPKVPGQPMLPMKPVMILVPADGKDLFIDVNYKDGIILPGEYNIPGIPEPQPIGVKTDVPPTPLASPFIDNDYTLEFADEGYLRGFRIVTYFYYPIHQLSGEYLEVTTRITFTLTYTPGVLPANPLPKHSVFRKVLASRLENPGDLNTFAPLPAAKPTGALTTKDVQYIIITNTSIVGSEFNNLIAWKTKKGVPAEIVEIDWIKANYNGNDTQEQIRNFIRDAVATWGSEYCLLGGDTSVVPYRSCYAQSGSNVQSDIAADLYFSDLDGNFDADGDKTYGETTDNVDGHPDIIVGRAPVETPGEVWNFNTKTLAYVKTPGENYTINATFAGEFLDNITNSSLGMDKIKNDILPSRYVSVSLFDSDDEKPYNLSKATFRNEMNNGSGLIFHSGHSNYNLMSMGSVDDNDFRWVIADANNLKNGYKIGVLYSLGCTTTKFDEPKSSLSDCIAEHHVMYDRDGTVAFIGNSRYGWYSPGFPGYGPSERYMKRMTMEIFNYSIVRVGDNFAAGKDFYVGWSGGNGSMRWLQYALNLLGDPEMYTWTDIPKKFNVTHPMEVYYGPQTLNVQVNDSVTKAPIENALVCVQGKDVYKYGYTDVNGLIELSMNLITVGVINVTATKHNYIPYEGNISKAKQDLNPPKIIIDTDEFGWYSTDPGDVITVIFDADGETDLSIAEYSLSPAGPWYTIFDSYRPRLTEPWNISKLWDLLPDGHNKICVRCNDSATPNHWAMGNITVKKDTVKPSVTVNTGSYGWFTTDPEDIFDVDFSNDSTGSPLDYAEYSINSPIGPWYNIFSSPVATYNTNWPVQWSHLKDGANKIYIRLFDEAGNEDGTLDTITILRDILPPIIVIRKDTYGWYSTDPGPVIDIDFSNGGNGSLLDYAQYKIGETGIWKDIFTSDTADYVTNWAVDWSKLVEGVNTIHLRCFDFVGYEDITSDNFTILKDTTAPLITINKNVYGWHSLDPGIIIDVDFSNNDINSSLLDYSRYRVHPEPGMGLPGPWRTIFNIDSPEYLDDWAVRWDDLLEGNNTIEIRVYDTAKNSYSTVDTVYFLKDTKKPAIITTTEKFGWYNSDPGAVIDVDFTNNDMGSNLDFAEYKINDGNWHEISQIGACNNTDDWSIDWVELVEGENTIEVRVWDVAGHYETQSIIVLKDTIDPFIAVNQEEYGWYAEDPKKALDVDFFSVDPNIENSILCSALKFAEYRISAAGEWMTIFETNLTDYTTSWALNWSMLKDGINEIFIRTCDQAGNLLEANTIVKFKKDTLPPNIIINESIYGWYSLDPGTVLDIDFSCLSTVFGSNQEPSNHSKVVIAQYMVSSNGAWCDIFFQSCEAFTDPWSVNWNLLKQGENIIQLRVIDEVGNVYYNPAMNITIKKDTEAPSILINQLEYGWFAEDPGEIIDVDFDAGNVKNRYENNSPLQKAEYKVGASGNWNLLFDYSNSEENTYSYSDNWSVRWDNTKEGINYIYFRVFDIAGNLYSPDTYVLFKRDTIGPEQPILISPVENGKTSDTTPQHHWKDVFDPGANITARYRLQLDTSGTFSNNLVDTETPRITYTHQTPLPLGFYYWRVQGLDYAGNVGGWSNTWMFEIVALDSAEVNQPPIANAGEDIVAAAREVIWFDGSRTIDPENDPLTFLWYLYDLSEPDAEGVRVNWTYSIPGVYEVKLEVFDANGGSDSDTVTVTILDVDHDTDKDGMPDAWEEFYGLDPQDPNDALDDLDNDGYINSIEYSLSSSPNNKYSTPASTKDNTPPRIAHTKVRYGRLLETIKITASVTDDDSGVKDVTLYYKKKTDLKYNALPMGHGNPYTVEIPASMATLDDLEYYIEAIDCAKVPNIAFFGMDGEVLIRPNTVNDIDIDIRENYHPPNEPNVFDEFIDKMDFASFEICLIVFIIGIILLVSFALSVGSAMKAKRLKNLQKRQRTIRVTHGKNQLWEGSEVENISEDEDLNLIYDDFDIDKL